jgi:transposase
MGLCLLVYTLGQRQIRTAVRESKLTVKNQLGKPTDRPTLRCIFPCFQSIHLVTPNQEKHICYWTQERNFIVDLLPEHCFPYYQLLT